MSTSYAYALVGLTVLLSVVFAIVTFAVLRLAAAARDARRSLTDRSEAVFVGAALQDAVGTLRAKERAMSARAEASERLNSEIVASVTAGLLVVGLDGGVRILNPAGRRLLGRSEAEPLEMPYTELLVGVPPLVAAIEECLAGGRAIVRRALEVPTPVAVTHLGVTVSPLTGADLTQQGAICLFSDLTEVVALEQQLRLKEALARLGELTAGIAHEFRNGLATIHGYARLMDPLELPSAYRPYLEGIRQETDALGQVVTNFLNFARETSLSLAPLSLRAVIDRASDDLRGDVDQAGGLLEVRGQFDSIDGDEVLLRQAVSNVLRNAVEACRDAHVPPRILVDGHVDRVARVQRVVVSDNGPGIDPAVTPRLFQPFFTTKASGTGLGLALVQKIVVLHNGRVVAVDRARHPGGGCVELQFPLSGAPA